MSKISEEKCPTCSFEAPTVKLVLSHLRSVHSSDLRFHIMCGIDGCARTYRKYSGLHSHLYRCHWSSTRGVFQSLDNPTEPVATVGDSMETTDEQTTDPLTMDVVPGKLVHLAQILYWSCMLPLTLFYLYVYRLISSTYLVMSANNNVAVLSFC